MLKPTGNSAPRPEPRIIFQKFFKSIGPRTYAAQMKELPNGNQLLVLTEGKRDPATDELRKTRLFIYSEDFKEFFAMVNEIAAFAKTHPLSPEVQNRRDAYWKKPGGKFNAANRRDPRPAIAAR